MSFASRKPHRLFGHPVAQARLSEFLRNGHCYPLTVVLHPTSLCQHRCTFCCNWQIRNTRSHVLDPSWSISLISDLAHGGVRNLLFSGGGEPLLYPSLGQVLRHALGQDLRVSLYTNLDCEIDNEVLELLPYVEWVKVTVDAVPSESYKASRGSNACLRRVGDNIRALVKVGVRVEGTVVIRDDNISTVEEVTRWLVGVGVGSVNVRPGFAIAYPDGVGVSQATIDTLREMSHAGSDRIRFSSPLDDVARDDQGESLCLTPQFDVTIGSDKCVYPCCLTAYDRAFCIVDLSHYHSFGEAWASQERYRWIEDFKPSCEVCWFSPANRFLAKYPIRITRRPDHGTP